MIKPTIGAPVWYWPNVPVEAGDQPWAATIVFVHGDRSVNLSVFNNRGHQFGTSHVLLMQGDESYKPMGSYCVWPAAPAAEPAVTVTRTQVGNVSHTEVKVGGDRTVSVKGDAQLGTVDRAPAAWSEQYGKTAPPAEPAASIADNLFIEHRDRDNWLVCVEKVFEGRDAAQVACEKWKRAAAPSVVTTDINPGDTVMLKSGGPEMLVTDLDSDGVIGCTWDQGGGAKGFCRLHVDAVRKVKTTPDQSAEAVVAAYLESANRGPAAYTDYADILIAIARGHRVEWLTPGGLWIYQHPSHTLKEIKGYENPPRDYRVVAPAPAPALDIGGAVSRFLAWRLPDDFAPDGYVAFDAAMARHYKAWPIGTNLLSADQARAMLEHVLGITAAPAHNDAAPAPKPLIVPLPRYQCHKVVSAIKIDHVFTTPRGFELHSGTFVPFLVSSAWAAKHSPGAGAQSLEGGYLVIYDDYYSWSPADVFEAGYTLVPADTDPEAAAK